MKKKKPVKKTAVKVRSKAKPSPKKKSFSVAPVAVKKKEIVLVLPFSPYIFGSDYYVALTLGAFSSLHKHNYAVKLTMIPTTPNGTWKEILADKETAGLLVVGDLMPEEFIKQIAKAKIPFVLLNNRLKGHEVNYVCCDNFNSSYDAVTYLASLGHKRIGMIKGVEGAMDASDRFEGYKEALEENALQFDPELVVAGDFTEIGGYNSMKRLLANFKDKNKRPSAVFCANDDTAIGAMAAMREESVKCPEEIALVGFDNIRLAAHVTPPLTTVNQPVLQMGTQAATNLMDIIEVRKGAPLISILPTELIIRKSCGVDDA